MEDRSRSFSDEELFMSRPGPNLDECETPIVEPLRIYKPQSPSPAAGPAAADRFRYPPPPTSSSASSAYTFPIASSSSPALSSSRPAVAPLPPLPSFPLPPVGLPYPEDDVEPSQPARPPYPVDDESWKPSSSASGRANTAALPAVSSSSSQSYNNPSPHPSLSPVDRPGAGLAERRGTAPRPLHSPESPIHPDKDGLFAKAINKNTHKISNAYQQKPYYPPPAPATTLAVDDANMNRFPSTASNSTTRASRGSPPPPETPVENPGIMPGAGIEARYAASGIPGAATLSGLQAQSAAAQSRLASYSGRRPSPVQNGVHTEARPWTPTESPGHQPYGPPTVYQGSDVVGASPRPQQQSSPPRLPATAPSSAASNATLQVSVLEQDFQRVQATTPPPAYTTVNPTSSSQFPNDKRRTERASSSTAVPTHNVNATSTSPPAAVASPVPAIQTAAHGLSSQSPAPSNPATAPAKLTVPAAAAMTSLAPEHAGHPAFANENRPEPGAQNGQAALGHTPSLIVATQPLPPLPEGWIAHLDQNSGQYYYIHLASQATQWEFPKGPNPIHHEPTPVSPTASTYGNPLASPYLNGGNVLGSPGFLPQTPGYAESIMSAAASATPTTLGFSGPPPSAGVDMFRIAPTNGVYFGPYLRYANMNVEKGVWSGSIMIVTDVQQPPTIHVHLSVDLSSNPRQLIPHSIFTHQRWNFYKYDLDLQMAEHGTERWTYAVTSHLGCTRYEFVVAGRHELGWRMIAHSGNDFSPGTGQNERAKLGGVGFMWKDILQKNVDCGGFHVQLGLGGQVFGDRLWKDVPSLRQWLGMAGRENRRSAQWTARHEEDVAHAYFHYYTSHLDQPFLREAFAQIPHVLQINGHDIFDGFGSYPDYMQQSAVFRGIGRIAVEMYLLFQHHTTVELLRNVSADTDLFTITGTGWHFLKYLGPAVVVVGPDTRSERTLTRVMAGPTYQGLFPKVALLPPSVQHCIWLMPVPVVYPRLEAVETLANTLATGKKAVNTTYNILGKVTSSVAGVVGGKEMVQQGFKEVKKAVGKSGLMGGVLNQFGDLDIADELRDLWTHESKDLERTYLIRTLQGIAQSKAIRMTFLSGSVNACGAGLLHDPTHPGDYKTMYQVIGSPVVAAPSSGYLLKMLHNNKLLYVPANGKRTTNEASDTKEDMMEIFHTDASGGSRDHKKLMARRNYVAIVAYDPAAPSQAATSQAATSQYEPSIASGTSGGSGGGSNNGGGLARLSLAVDFVVQGDGAFATPTKYGPVIVPHLDFGGR